MNDIVLWIYAFVIAIGLSSMFIVPLLGLCYHATKIKLEELKERKIYENRN